MNNDIKAIALTVALTLAMGATLALTNLDGAAAAQLTGDFRDAAVAEIHDAQGQVLLRGAFAAVDGDDAGEVERHAKLTAASPGSAAAGEAEVEYQTDDPTKQEVECSVTGLAPGSTITFVIDGKQVASATADKRGRVEVELSVKPGA